MTSGRFLYRLSPSRLTSRPTRDGGPGPCRRVDHAPQAPTGPAGPGLAKAKTKEGPARRLQGRRRPWPNLRSEIDRIDKELVDLLNRRSEVAVQIGQIKQAQGLDIWSSSREDEVVARALEASRGPLPHETLRLIFRELMSSSRSLQRQLRVACLGPKYSYSHLASVAKFGESVEHVPVGSIAAVFEEVNRRHVQFGIVPLENSTDGRIADTLDMFVRLPGLKIRAEVRLRVRHCLLGKGEWGDVRRVYSKAQAISQCRNWLGKNLPQATMIDVVSSAEAAAIAQRDPPGRRHRQQAGRRRLWPERPGREHRGPGQQHHPIRRDRRARRAADRSRQDDPPDPPPDSNQAGSLAKAPSPRSRRTA